METENLLIRPTEFKDCNLFAKWEVLPEVTRFFSISKNRTLEEIVREFILRKEDDEHLQFTIVLKKENRPIGRIWISSIDTHGNSLDITRIYVADMKDRGYGYGEEALLGILKHFFLNLKIERVTLDFFTGNEIAHNLYKKVGFSDEGCMRSAARKNGKYYDLNLMSILREEFISKYGSK